MKRKLNDAVFSDDTSYTLAQFVVSAEGKEWSKDRATIATWDFLEPWGWVLCMPAVVQYKYYIRCIHELLNHALFN
jgi:hypothetical protein